MRDFPNSRSPDITLVGAGTWATALASALHKQAYRVSEIIGRDTAGSRARARVLARRVRARVVTMEGAALSSAITWICVPDDVTTSVVAQLGARAGWGGKFVVHSSGALPADILSPLRHSGASIASAHPLMTFVSASRSELKNVPFALEGDSKCLSIIAAVIRAFGGKPFRIPSKLKPAYHAFGFFSSPGLVALIAAAQQVGKLAGLNERRARELMEPIVRQTIENCFRTDPAAAFSGPWRRGDVATVRKHVEVLRQKHEVLQLYRALGKIALQQLPVSNPQEFKKLLRALD